MRQTKKWLFTLLALVVHWVYMNIYETASKKSKKKKMRIIINNIVINGELVLGVGLLIKVLK